MDSIDKFLAKSEVKNERYDQYSSQLFDLIDEIERYGFLKNVLTIPNVVAAGDQTSGKSSVLGKLSGIALPTGDGTVTVCATQLQSRKAKGKSTCRMFAPEEKDINVEDISSEVNEASKKLVSSESGDGGFNLDTMARIRIENSDARNLTIVDLPGIIHSANKRTQDESVVEKVRDMVWKYISVEKSIILCVIDMTRDLALNKIFDLVNSVDPEGQRTVVVFTKIDKCVVDKSRLQKLLQQIANQDYHKYKHCVFVNSAAKNDAQEAEIFRPICKEFGIPPDHCSFQNLYKKVCYMLLKPILEEFRSSWTNVENLRCDIGEELNGLPETEQNTSEAVDKKLQKFIEAARDTLKGNYSPHVITQDMFSRQRVCFERFKQCYQQKMVDVENSKNMGEVVSTWRKGELVNFHNYANFKTYAVPIVTSFVGPAMICKEEIRNLNREVIMQLVFEMFDGQQGHIDFLLARLKTIFENAQQILSGQLENVHKYEQYFYTDDHLYLKILKRLDLDERMEQMRQTYKRIKSKSAGGSRVGINLKVPNDDDDDEDTDFRKRSNTRIRFETHDDDTADFMDMMSSCDGLFGDDVLKYESQKKATYESALEVLKDLAMDRISIVVPSTILYYLNDEVQREIQMIDREVKDFCELQWSNSKSEMRRKELEEQELLISKWQLEYLKIESQIKSASS
ncbi:interferon-induced GTP-binding protein Mx1-like [Symsagittifera roscoffensis]|uniref:interferon-induced GTP-binding protein Mx1-like n=1 Tax=Symsagittifera roscoffensis TaxID=84072 RepID=UPI00307C295B